MVTPADLTMLRATQNSLMPGTAEIVRRTDGTRDAFGDVTETWATVATVPCRLAAAKRGNAGGEVVTVRPRVLTNNTESIRAAALGYGRSTGYFPPVVEMPWMNVFCAMKKRTMTGKVNTVAPAMSCAQRPPSAPRNCCRP